MIRPLMTVRRSNVHNLADTVQFGNCIGMQCRLHLMTWEWRMLMNLKLAAVNNAKSA